MSSISRSYKRRRVSTYGVGYSKKAKMLHGSIAGISYAAKKLYSMYNSKSKGEGTRAALTNQNDTISLYKRRRAPRRVRRRARRRYRNFLSKQLRMLPDNTQQFNQVFTNTSTLNAQHFSTFTLFPMQVGLGVSTNNFTCHVQEAFDNVLNAASANASSHIYITGMNYDFTLANVSDKTAELDIYEFVIRKDKTFQPTAAFALTSAYVDANDDEDVLPGASTKIALSDPGATPFDVNQMSKYVLLKSKQRIYLSAGQATSFVRDIKMRRPVKITSEELHDTSLGSNEFTVKAGISRGIIMVHKGVPDATDNFPSVEIKGNVQAKLRFKVQEPNQNQNALGF